MKTFDLSETSAAGDNNPQNTVYRVNGKRVSRSEFDAIKRAPGTTLDSFYNARNGGNVTFYCVARTDNRFTLSS